MPKVVVAQGLTVLREAAYNTDPGISTSNGLENVEATLTIDDAFDGQRAGIKHGTGGTLPPTRRAGRAVSLSIRGELKGRGAAYTDALVQWPFYNVMLGAGLSGTVTGGAIALSPVRPDKAGSFTAGVYGADAYYKVTGVRGSVTFLATAPAQGFFEFSGQGVLADDYPTEVALPSITYATNSGLPPAFVDGQVTLGALSPVIGAFRFAINNVVAPRLDGNATLGHAGFVITDRSVEWGFPTEAVLLGTYDPYSTSLSGTTQALSLTLGQDAGNKFVFANAKASLNPPDFQDENGRLVWGMSGLAHITSGNDEISISVE